jgi:NAD-dependent dihydropyrimidine dehydrogenase PreA subunit
MPYVIAEPCIGVKDTACVSACPVDCIHPRSDETAFADAAQLYIDPVECIGKKHSGKGDGRTARHHVAAWARRRSISAASPQAHKNTAGEVLHDCF